MRIYRNQSILLLLRNSSLQFLFVFLQKLIFPLLIQDRNHAIIALGRATAFQQVALHTVSPGISTLITQFSSQTLTSSPLKIVTI